MKHGRPGGPSVLSRRAFCLAAAALALPSPTRAGAPSRVACLEWTAAETAIALGVRPIAVSDVAGYRDWTVTPELPPRVLDLGSRFEPNLERLREIAPDLIVVSSGYGVVARDVEKIAPAHELVPYAIDHLPLEHARIEAERLASRLGRPQEAAKLLVTTNEAIDAARGRIAGNVQRPVCIVSLFDDRNIRFYGKGGLFQEVLERLEVRNGWPFETNRWGFSVAGLDRLAGLPSDTLLVMLDPTPPQIRARLDQSSLWRAAPAVRNGLVTSIAPVWPFGGLSAAARFATLLADRLAAT